MTLGDPMFGMPEILPEDPVQILLNRVNSLERQIEALEARMFAARWARFIAGLWRRWQYLKMLLARLKRIRID